MFNNTKYSNATIIIYNVTLPVYKFVVYTQSEYFKKAFQVAFIEGSSGELIFNGGSGAAHWRVFEYLYTGDYSDPPLNNLEGKLLDDSPLLKDPCVYALADMFFLEDLKALSVARAYTYELGKKATFRDLLREGGDFAVDFTKRQRSEGVFGSRKFV
ncbi:hypothetical protein P154DRAFT_549934 [Amniculicola lignicola CBS 123094]|uniref:BTB domain-containing protein n=1 Tax=Amniculicola lignicola CBS 123094 TaxID=1392246 RepID=A0A6A5W535_9PLEO|nr:hypothetical protein P154DRAFT_549934 [Amniculicola lignicola CBS 123094]